MRSVWTCPVCTLGSRAMSVVRTPWNPGRGVSASSEWISTSPSGTLPSSSEKNSKTKSEPAILYSLRSILRHDPDVILVGEIRDRETMEAAIALAGTGHLCIATLHANNCAETLDRIINMFPRDQHNQIFLDLSQYLRAILSQRLVAAKSGIRVAASEVMVNTPYVSELIKKGDVIGVKEAIRTGTERGMLSFDSSLYNLVREGRIELEEALSSADSRTNLEAKINFG